MTLRFRPPHAYNSMNPSNVMIQSLASDKTFMSHTLHITPSANNVGQYYINFSPLEATVGGEKEEVLPPGPDQWRESDYLDRAEMFKLMGEDKEWDYSQCQWIMRQEEHDGAFPGGWQHWYTYAIAHCPRFRREQPQWRER